jgi:hypothetical protein
VSVHGRPALPLDSDLAGRLTIQASRRQRPGDTRDVREVMADLARGALIELVERLESESEAPCHALACRCPLCQHSRFCRCAVCEERRR